MKNPVFLILSMLLPLPLLTAAGLSGSDDGWTLPSGASIRDQILTISIPADRTKGQHLARKTIDLSGFRGKQTTFSIRMRSKNLIRDRADRTRRGVQFKLTYLRPDGKRVWHHSWDTWDSVDWTKYSRQKQTDWQTISFLSPIDSDVTEGELLLGTENNSGEIEFDLNSFEMYELFPPSVSKQKCVYSEKMNRRPPRRGVACASRRLTEQDFQTLKSWNVNLIRWPISAYPWEFDGKDLTKLRTMVDRKLRDFDHVTALAEKYGIAVILCYALPPGGRMNDATFVMQSRSVEAECFFEIWEKIARHCKGNKALYGYDLINEPSQRIRLLYDYRSIQERAAKRIRAVDPETPVILESNLLASPETFRSLEPLDMKDVVYQLHMYIPDRFTHAAVGSYPGVIEGKKWTKEELRAVLKPVRDFQERHHAKIYAGEFSARSRAIGAENYLRDCIELFEEYGWDWTYHAFREAPTWDVEKTEQNGKHFSAADTPRKQILLNAFKQNRKNP